MAHSSSVSQDLFALGDALGNPDVDPDALLRGPTETARAAVASCTGLRLTVLVDGDAVVLDTLSGSTARVAVRTSLLVPLPTSGSVATSTLTLWATTPGAFVDLAADLALDRPVTTLVLDADLPTGAAVADSGLATLSLVQQAVGVLIAQGLSPERARTELARRAAEAGTSSAVAAGLVVDAVRRWAGRPSP